MIKTVCVFRGVLLLRLSPADVTMHKQGNYILCKKVIFWIVMYKMLTK